MWGSVIVSLVPYPLALIMMCHPAKMLSHCCAPKESRSVEAQSAPPNRSSEPFRVAIGDTGWNGACLRAMTQITHKTGAQHADTSLWRAGWCWAGEEIPPPPLTRTVIVLWLLQRRHLLDIWRSAVEKPQLINEQLLILFRHYLTIKHRPGRWWTGNKDVTRGWKPSWWVFVSGRII